MVRHCQVLHCLALQFGPPVSGPSMSGPAFSGEPQNLWFQKRNATKFSRAHGAPTNAISLSIALKTAKNPASLQQ